MYYDPGIGATDYVFYDADLDSHTGLPRTLRDPNGLATELTYDPLGRLAGAVPEEGARIEVTYEPPAAGAGARVTTIARSHDGAEVLAEAGIELDDFGARPARERRRQPDGSAEGVLVERETVRNARGWLESRSTWGLGFRIEFLEHDPFGRPRRVRPPDSLAPDYGHDLEIEYFGRSPGAGDELDRHRDRR